LLIETRAWGVALEREGREGWRRSCSCEVRMEKCLGNLFGTRCDVMATETFLDRDGDAMATSFFLLYFRLELYYYVEQKTSSRTY
jgi:hypothetical protein